MIEEWLEQLARFKSSIPFEKVGKAIADAIIITECPDVFGNGEGRFIKIKTLLALSGVPVAHVGVGQREGHIFIGLLGSRNWFDAELVIAIKAFVKKVNDQLKDLKKDPR